MCASRPTTARVMRRTGLLVLVAALLLASQAVVQAQNSTGSTTNTSTNFVNGAVGGVSIDPGGMLKKAAVDEQGGLAALRGLTLDPVPGDFTVASKMRKISLRRLEDKIHRLVELKQQLPDSILFLAGLQQIHYVMFYPEQNDIVLVGPAEGWKLNPRGAVVGQTTGWPVMLLDDLLVVLRRMDDPPRSVISCSIDPTPEGLQRLKVFSKSLRGMSPQQAAAGIEQQLGPQSIAVTGVPDTSHFATVLVAADYRMKRISMGLDPAPIPNFPGFMDLMRGGGMGMQNMLPRWWLTPNYQPLLRDVDGLAWQLRGGSVKAMCESDYLDSAGVRHQGGKAGAPFQRWADLMTQRYNELALADPIFGQLRNCMDLSVVAALIAQQMATDKINCDLPFLSGDTALPTARLNAPRQVDSNASLVHATRKWMIAAGGVSINPWAIIKSVDQDKELAEVRTKMTSVNATAWWWD